MIGSGLRGGAAGWLAGEVGGGAHGMAKGQKIDQALAQALHNATGAPIPPAAAAHKGPAAMRHGMASGKKWGRRGGLAGLGIGAASALMSGHDEQ